MNGKENEKAPGVSVTLSDYSTSLALVTGGARRIGRALVLKLAELGFRVAVHCHSSEREAQELVEQIKSRGGQGQFFIADLRQGLQVRSLFRQVSASMGLPSVLINNASVFHPEKIEDFDENWALDNFRLHVNASLLLSQAMYIGLKNKMKNQIRKQTQDENARAPCALIVNMLDQRVLNPTPGYISYNATKWALSGMTQSLAIELAPCIRVNAIAPGPVLPPEFSDGSGFTRYCCAMPLGRGSSLEEIARVLQFLIESRATTGQIIASDGGQNMGYLSRNEAALTRS